MAQPLFTICTLMTNQAQYEEMRASFVAKGFQEEETEFLCLDNSNGNRWDAFSGIALFMTQAKGRFLIICHQDIRLIDSRTQLCEKLSELDTLDRFWALAGNAGGTVAGGIATRISDPHGEDQRRGSFPAKAVSLDENFILLRRDAPIGISATLSGFHFYGTDLCLQARFAGRSAWIIDFHLRHLSAGRVDRSFYLAQQALQSHYNALLSRPWKIRTTCTRLNLGHSLGGLVRQWFANRRLARRLNQAP